MYIYFHWIDRSNRCSHNNLFKPFTFRCTDLHSEICNNLYRRKKFLYKPQVISLICFVLFVSWMNTTYKNPWIHEIDGFWLLCNFVHKKTVVSVKQTTYLNCKFDIVHVTGIMLSKFSLRRKILSMKPTSLHRVHI